MTRSEWFWSEEGQRDLAAVREILRLHPVRPPIESLASDMGWLLYQQRVRITTQLERRLAVVTHEVLHGSW